MIIKAGTYRFNDTVLFPSTNISVAINFKIEPETNVVYFCNSISVINVSDTITQAVIGIYGVEAYGVYEEGNISLVLAASNTTNDTGGNVNVSFQNITVTTDTEVTDETSFNWFTSNTQMLIDAGTYRWNDIVTLPNPDYDTPYEVNSTIRVKGDIVYKSGTIATYSNLYLRGIWYHDNSFQYDLYTNPEGDSSSETWQPVVYSQENGWNAGSVDEEYTELWNIPESYGQIITVTSDQYVPTNFGLWAVENWQEYSEEETPTLPAVEITYKDTVIILNAGQTAKLHMAEQKLTEDLVIKANEVEAAEPKLQEKVVTLTENGVGTKILPDDGYDGLSVALVTVDVQPNLQVKEKVIEVNNVGTTITPDEGYDGLSAVLVSVAIPETVITVASVDDLPTDSADGTIAIVEG